MLGNWFGMSGLDESNHTPVSQYIGCIAILIGLSLSLFPSEAPPRLLDIEMRSISKPVKLVGSNCKYDLVTNFDYPDNSQMQCIKDEGNVIVQNLDSSLDIESESDDYQNIGENNFFLTRTLMPMQIK
jgi:hypothetical protein